jgi:exopolysaccharide biosynthesis polyprenyl glycosylphosphotransferase
MWLLVARAVLDLAAVAAAWWVAVELRVRLNPWLSLEITPAEALAAAPPLSALLALWLAAALSLRVYRREGGAAVWRSALAAGTVAVVVTFFSREFGASRSRSIVLLFVPASLVLLLAAQWTARRLQLRFGRRERVAMLGQGPEVVRLTNLLAHGSLAVAGVILPEGCSGRSLGGPVRVLGTTRQLGALINRERLNRLVIVEDRPLPRRELGECERVSKRMGVVVSRTLAAQEPDLRLGLAEWSGVPLLEWRPVVFRRGQEFAKRWIDLGGAALLVLLLAPLLALTALLVKLTSPGPVLFRAPRAGRGGRHFLFLKFRTMYAGQEERNGLAARNEQSGHLFKMRRDPRVTPLGHWLRRSSIDELPQLLNVLRGEMSLVGPRPLPAQDLDPDGQSHGFRAWSEHRSRVLPGLTGLWQVQGRSELSFDRMVELDLEYVRRWSLWLDCRILLATPRAVWNGRGAY